MPNAAPLALPDSFTVNEGSRLDTAGRVVLHLEAMDINSVGLGDPPLLVFPYDLIFVNLDGVDHIIAWKPPSSPVDPT